MKPAVFLDRDGVINKNKGYTYQIKDFEWISGAKKAIKYFNKKNFYVFVVTNQSGISRGFFNENDLERLHSFICKDLKKEEALIDEFFYSPYHPDGISDKYDHLKSLRKPNTGMLELACAKWEIDIGKSIMIGDSQTDIECAHNFGIHGYLFNENNLLSFVEEQIKIR